MSSSTTIKVKFLEIGIISSDLVSVKLTLESNNSGSVILKVLCAEKYFF